MRIGTSFNTTLLFIIVRAEVFHGIPEKNRDFAIQFFVQTIFHFSTSLCYVNPGFYRDSLIPHTIGNFLTL